MLRPMSTKLEQFTSLEKSALLKHFPQGIIGLDMETTGLSPMTDKVIELAAIKITKEGEFAFSELINPQIPIPARASAIHGITDDMVRLSATAYKVWPQFIQFMGQLPLVAHNARFDIGFWTYGAHQLNLSPGQSAIYCSCQLAKKAFPNASNHKLSTLAHELEIKLTNHHRAWDDAVAGLKVFAQGLLALEDKAALALKSAHLFALSDFSQSALEQEQATSAQAKRVELIKELINKQEVFEIRYAAGSVRNQWRPLLAVSLLPMPHGLGLYAHCYLSDHYKYFRVDKISDVRSLSSDQQEYWKKHLLNVKNK